MNAKLAETGGAPAPGAVSGSTVVCGVPRAACLPVHWRASPSTYARDGNRQWHTSDRQTSSAGSGAGGAVLPGTCSWERMAWIALAVIALLVQLSPVAQAALQFDRDRIAAGEFWRLLTGNFVHYSWPHLVANLGAFAALCWMAEGRARGVLALVTLSALAVGAGVFSLAGGVTTYRGVSGVDCALAAWVLTTMAFQDGRLKGLAWVGVLAILAFKSIFEAVTGQLMLPTSAPAGVAVVGVTHVIGLAVGIAAAMITRTASRQRGSRRCTAPDW